MDVIRPAVWGLALLGAGCGGSTAPFARTERTVTQGRVQQVLQAGPYTYLQVTSDADTLWVAALQQEPAVGSAVKVTVFARRLDFHSARLNRTFGQLAFGMVQTAHEVSNEQHQDGGGDGVVGQRLRRAGRGGP